MLVGQTQTFPDGLASSTASTASAGTSLSSPLMAVHDGARVQQKAGHVIGLREPGSSTPRTAAASYDDHRRRTGLANLGAVRVDYANYVDDTDGYLYSVRWFDDDTSLTIHVRPQYDDVTGVGSPDGEAWLDAVANGG